MSTYIEVANEHRLPIEQARRIVAHCSQYGVATQYEGEWKLARALVAIDEAMRDLHERPGPEPDGHE